MSTPDSVSLDRYYRLIALFPVLSTEDELCYMQRWKKSGDRKAYDILYKSGFKITVQVAWEYRGRGVSLDDLVQQGNLGLIEALKRFEMDRGVRLSTYAVWWVRSFITKYLVDNKGIIRFATTTDTRKIFFGLSRARARLEQRQSKDYSLEELAVELGVPLNILQEILPRMVWQDTRLDTQVSEEDRRSFGDILYDQTVVSIEDQCIADEEFSLYKHYIIEACSILGKRERRIIKERYLKERAMTLQELGNEFGLSRERVRQLEEIALRKIRKFINSRTRRFKQGKLE